MNSMFWTNTIWYIALAATSAVTIVAIFIKTHERKKTFAFYFAVLGFTYAIEVSLLLLFNAYTYYPMIKPDDQFFDAVLGNIFSQVSVSSSAILICVLGLSHWWRAGFSIAYFLIDVLFVQLGIYEHYWYRSIYTLAGFFVYSLIIKYWYKRVFSGASKWIYYPTLFLSAWAASANLLGTSLKLLGLRILQSSFYPDPSRNHTATGLIYMPLLIIIMMALYKGKAHWGIKVFVITLLMVCQWGLINVGIMKIAPGWHVIVILLDLAVFYGLTVMMGRSLKCAPPLQPPVS